MKQTLAQKILQKHTDEEITADGQIVNCRLDLVLANDITEVQPTAETTTDTTVSSQSSTTAKRESETRRGSVTQTAAELLSTDSGSSAATAAITASAI